MSLIELRRTELQSAPWMLKAKIAYFNTYGIQGKSEAREGVASSARLEKLQRTLESPTEDSSQYPLKNFPSGAWS
jgi:hypothetical protein